MLALVFAAVISSSSVTNTCPTCSGVGRVELPCPECKGKGQLTQIKRGSSYSGVYNFKPCPKCSGKNTLAGPRQKSSGKINVKCPICNGRKLVSDGVLKAVLTGRKKK